MNISSMLAIFRTMLETALIARAQFVMARAYKDTPGMVEAMETAILIDEDIISILDGAGFRSIELSGSRVPGNPEEILELMRTMKQLETANITDLLKSFSGEPSELEERRHAVLTHKMDAVGRYFRTLKRVLQEQWKAWNSSYEKEFSSMLRLKAPRKKI